MNALKDPKEIVDSIGNGALSAVQVFPRVALNVATVAQSYASGANRNINELKTNILENPTVIPQVLGNAFNDTISAGMGFVDGIAKAGEATVADIKTQINRGTR